MSLEEEGNLDPEGEHHVEMEAETGGTLLWFWSTNQRLLATDSDHRKLGEKHGADAPSGLTEGTNLTSTLISESGLQN